MTDLMRPLPPARANRIRAAVIDQRYGFSDSWAQVPERVVAPAEELSSLEDDPRWIAFLAAFAAAGPELYGLTAADLGPDNDQQAVVLPTAAVASWRWTWLPFDLLFITPDLKAAVYLSVDEFSLVAGPRSFVEKALGRTAEQNCAEFTVYARELATAARHLPELAQKWCPSC